MIGWLVGWARCCSFVFSLPPTGDGGDLCLRRAGIFQNDLTVQIGEMAAIAERNVYYPTPCRRRDWTHQAADAMAVENPFAGKEEEKEEEEEVLDCSICMCAVTGEEDEASLDKCTHAFHFACIIKVRAVWVHHSRACSCTYIQMRIQMHIPVHLHIRIQLHIPMHLHIRIQLQTYVHLQMRIQMHILMHIYTHIQIRIQMHTRMRIQMRALFFFF